MRDQNMMPYLLIALVISLNYLKPETTVVAIDEAQFFDPEIVQIVSDLADNGKRVIVAGLDTDFRGEPFGPMPIFMSKAETVDKLAGDLHDLR